MNRSSHQIEHRRTQGKLDREDQNDRARYGGKVPTPRLGKDQPETGACEDHADELHDILVKHMAGGLEPDRVHEPRERPPVQVILPVVERRVVQTVVRVEARVVGIVERQHPRTRLHGQVELARSERLTQHVVEPDMLVGKSPGSSCLSGCA